MTEKTGKTEVLKFQSIFKVEKKEKFQISKFLEILKEKTRKTEVFEFYSIFKV